MTRVANILSTASDARERLPTAYLGPDLVAALAGLDVDDLSHVWCWCWSGGEWRLAAEGARESPRSRDQATSGSGPDQARPAATVPLPRSFRGQPLPAHFREMW